MYAHRNGRIDAAAVPNQSALGAAALINKPGNVLAIMPHPERDGWSFNHPDQRGKHGILEPSGGSVLFQSFVNAVNVR